MADEPFYSPNAKPPPARKPRPGETLWSLRKNGITWEAELRYHAEFGVEAQILRQGELVMQWAETGEARIGHRGGL